jgi:serine phosphatase RsbU (regulator of sigma subunit)
MRFQEMLATHNDKPLHIQKEIFISELNEHRLDTPSRDDITLVGVRL